MATQKLITKELQAKLPALYATDGANDPIAVVKLFTPFSSWTWLLSEFDPDTGRAFGFCYNGAFPDGAELGYVDVNELQALRQHGAQAVERDAWFKPKPMSEAIAAECPGASSIYPRDKS